MTRRFNRFCGSRLMDVKFFIGNHGNGVLESNFLGYFDIFRYKGLRNIFSTPGGAIIHKFDKNLRNSAQNNQKEYHSSTNARMASQETFS